MLCRVGSKAPRPQVSPGEAYGIRGYAGARGKRFRSTNQSVTRSEVSGRGHTASGLDGGEDLDRTSYDNVTHVSIRYVYVFANDNR